MISAANSDEASEGTSVRARQKGKISKGNLPFYDNQKRTPKTNINSDFSKGKIKELQ